MAAETMSLLCCIDPVGRGQQLRQVDLAQDAAVLQRDHADDELARGVRCNVGHRLDVIVVDGQDVGHQVRQQAHDPAGMHRDDDDMAVGRRRRTEAKPCRQVDDRHDRSAQVDHAFDVVGRMGQHGREGPAANFADQPDVDAEVLIGQLEGHDVAFADGIMRDGLQHASPVRCHGGHAAALVVGHGKKDFFGVEEHVAEFIYVGHRQRPRALSITSISCSSLSSCGSACAFNSIHTR